MLSYLEVVMPGYKFNSALINKYHDGDSHIPPHGDTEPEIAEGSDIVTISLGETRTIIFSNKKGDLVFSDKLRHGEVMVMSQQSQSVYSHQIPKELCCRTRISITLRLIQPYAMSPPLSAVNKSPVTQSTNSDCGYAPFQRNQYTGYSNISPSAINNSQKGSINNHQSSPSLDQISEVSTTVYISSLQCFDF